MILAFVIWSVLAVIFGIIGIMARKSQKPVGFWANSKAPDITDIVRYNRAVSVLWFVFAVLYEVVGIPLLFCKQNSLLALISVFGAVALALGLMIGYIQIEIKYKK